MPDERTIFRLSVITTQLGHLLLPAMEKQFWVRAHFITDKSGRTGHCYGNLVEVDERGQEKAKLRAVIWRDDLQRIEQTLLHAGCPDVLHEGGEICALCSVRWHTVHGLSLTIFDVAPTLGESHINRQRRVVLERLDHEGLIGKNKLLALTVVPLRIGLVTADGSAALADFRQTLLLSVFGFQILLAPATMQGDATFSSVVDAIERLHSHSVDLICVIRGGGEPAHLAWLDAEPIARAVALCPVPVWVGIGHEIDHGILDVIAHASHKTPTAVAHALVDRLAELAARLESARERLRDACERQTALADLFFQKSASSLREDGRKHLERFEVRFAVTVERFRGAARRVTEQAEIRIRNAARSLRDGVEVRQTAAEQELARNRVGLFEGTRKLLELQTERHHRRRESLVAAVERIVAGRHGELDTAATKLRERVRGTIDRFEQKLRLRTERFTLETFARRIDAVADGLAEKAKRLEALNPERLLARGYTITRDDAGNLITSAAALAAGQKIHTHFRDGTATIRAVLRYCWTAQQTRGESPWSGSGHRDVRMTGPVF